MIDAVDPVCQHPEPPLRQPEQRFGQIPWDRDDPGAPMSVPVYVGAKVSLDPCPAFLSIGATYQAVDICPCVLQKLVQ